MEWILTGEDATNEKSRPAPPDLEAVKQEQGLVCDGSPLTDAETDLVAMFRLLPSYEQEDLFDLVYFKYKKHVEQKKESIYWTYFDENIKSGPAEGDDAQVETT